MASMSLCQRRIFDDLLLYIKNESKTSDITAKAEEQFNLINYLHDT